MPLSGVPEQFAAAADRAEFCAGPRPGVELYRAQIVHHAFAPHSHEGYGFGVIEAGAERFRYRGSDYLAGPGALVTMNPDVLHTGAAAGDEGWRYRMIYLTPAVLAEISGEPGWWYAQPLATAPSAQVRQIELLLQALWQCADALTGDSLLALLLDALRPATQGLRPVEPPLRMSRVLDYMHSHLASTVRLEDLAAVAELSPFHFLRQFRACYHVTPQQMLMALRLQQAKQRLALGQPLATVAAEVGLSDQAHLTRAFYQRYGTTPAAYRRQIQRA
ncbi:AraC family transcriptional regulator [Dechloromonas sp. ZY10]|uniref:AraC family transcriptional regulator n=1 Tax=Dechloromonas aquae TaxID=2664436 RepID=UPI0035271E25